MRYLRIYLIIVIFAASYHIAAAEEIVINSSSDSVYVYDDFDIFGSPISAVNGTSGMGWSESWQAPASNGTVSISPSSLDYPSSVDLTATGGHAYSSSPFGQGVSRQLLNPVKLGEETTTFYISFLTKKDANGNYRIDGLTSSGSAAGFAVGITPDGRLKVNAGNTAGWGAVTTQSDPGIIENDIDYFIVAQYQYDNAQSSVKVAAFKEGDAVPADDVTFIWDYEATGGSLATSVNSFRLAFSKGLGRIDEFRLGSTWASVVSLDISEPELAIGTYRFPNFDWEDHPAQFADVASPISYEIQIAEDEQFSSIIDNDTVLLSRYVHDQPFNPGSYYWRTRSITYAGNISEWQDTVSFTIEEPQEVITVSLPGGQEDCTASIQASVAQAEASASVGNSVKLLFPAGDYYFGESLVGEVISLSGVKNIEIEGSGAIFHLSKRNQGLIEATACENISVSGINVTYAKGILRVQGHILSVDESNRTAIVSIEEGSPGFEASSAPDHDIFILLDPDIDGRIKDQSSNFYRKDSYVNHQDGTYTIQVNAGGDFSDWEVGDRFVYHFRSGSAQYVDFGESKNMTVYNVSTDGWGAMGFVSVKGSNFNILNCKTVMQEGKWMMGNADGVHVREHIVGPWIEGTEIQATGDDGLAFYARSIAMTAVNPGGDPKSVICVSEYFNLDQGDEVAFFQPGEGRIILETTVTKVMDLGGSYKATFADTIPGGIILGSPLTDVTQIWNRSKSCGEFMIRNCKFTNNRRYANVFRSKRGVVENNEYRGASSRAIHFRNETLYPNGLYASEIIVRNNSIEDCSFDGPGTQAAIAFTFEGRNSAVQSIGPRNILIEGQVIKDCPSPEILLRGAENVVIRNNLVILADDVPDDVEFSATRTRDIDYSTQVNPEKNVFVPGPEIHIISAAAGSNGSIAPGGAVTLFSGDSETFTFSPNAGYEVEDVLVNGISKGALDVYTLNNVASDQSISVTFTKIPGADNITPEADAYVHAGQYENTNYGSSESLVIKTSDTPDYKRQSYLRFDISSIENPITSAKLQLRLAAINGNSTPHNAMFVADDSWGETSITWVNKPSEGAVLSTRTTPAVGSWIEFDITAQAETERSGDGKISIMLSDAGNSEVMSTYYSREAIESSPSLIIMAPDPVYYTITASAGDGGSISPSGEMSVLEGGSQAYTFSADPGYEVENVLANGVSQGSLDSYEFTDVKVNSTIHVSFRVISSIQDEVQGAKTKIKVYPNPATSEFTVELKNISQADLSLFDLAGKLVWFREDVRDQLTIPVNSLGKGLYILKVRDDTELYKEKIIVH
jgi:hypothetical protein